MPTIEISRAQATRLARGESITIYPPRPRSRTYIAVFDNGNVFKVELAPGRPNPTEGPDQHIDLKGRCTLIAKGVHPEPLGHTQSSCGGNGYVIPVPE